MKCHNCGFESETNFCPMCGAKMSQSPAQAPTEQALPFTQSVPNTNNTTTQPIQQNIQGNPYVQNTPPVQQNFQRNPYIQNTAPVQQNMQSNPVPTTAPASNMQYATPPAMQPQKPKSKATAGIIIASIIGAVILVGMVIFSCSCISNSIKKSESAPKFELTTQNRTDCIAFK